MKPGLSTFKLVESGLRIGMPAYQQWVVIQEIKRLGGEVIAAPVGPKWLHHLAGDERMAAFDTVISVNLNWSRATDGTLRRMKCLTDLKLLELRNTRVTNAGLESIEGMSLFSLDLGRTQVTDAGVANLLGQRKLRFLDIEMTGVTDAGLARLAELPNLRLLSIGGTELISQAQITALEAVLPKLEISQTPAALSNMHGINEEYRRLLSAADEPHCYDVPTEFNCQLLTDAVSVVLREIAEKLHEPTKFELTTESESANCRIAIIIENRERSTGAEIRRSEIRFSNFGRLTSVTCPELMSERLAADIVSILEAAGFHYIPVDVLNDPYDGFMAGDPDLPSWWIRYFGWD